MGRGQATLRDQFSAIFGNRRGARRDDEDGSSKPLRQTWSTQPQNLSGNWGGAGFHGGVLFLFPRDLSMGSFGEGSIAHSFLEDFYPGISTKLSEPRADGIFIPPEIVDGDDARANNDAYEIAERLAAHMGFDADEVVALTVLQGARGNEALGRKLT